MTVEVKFMLKKYGHKNGTYTVQQFKDMFETQMKKDGQWAIFQEDTAIPDSGSQIHSMSQVKDGTKLTLVPQFAGG